MALPNISDYLVPENPTEAVELLQKHGDSAMMVAGGTFVHGLEVRGLISEIEVLIDLGHLGLDRIEATDDGLTVGSTAKFADLDGAEAVNSSPAFGAVKDALRYPPAQIRNLGTVGGCIGASAPLYDLPASLIAMDAEVNILGAGGSRSVPLGDFFVGLFENVLTTGELITDVRIPGSAGSTSSAFLKLETNANDLAIVNVAVRITRGAEGECLDSRIIIGGGIGETYFRSSAGESSLNGAELNEQNFAAAADAVAGEIEPVSDHRGSAEYRRHIAKVYTRRALARAAARLD